jgi:hypothetical protein
VIGRLVRLLVIMALMVGFVLLAGRLLQKNQKAVRQLQGAPHHLVVDLGAGSVTVTGRSGPDTTVHRSVRYGFRKPTFHEGVDGDHVAITATCPGWTLSSCAVSYTIEVPKDETVDVHTSAGSVKVRILDGPIKVTSSAGSITVDDVGGRQLALRTTAGSITATRVRSNDVDARTSAGSIHLAFTAAPEKVGATTSAGSVDIAVPGGTYRVDTHTSAGSSNVDVATNPDATRTISATTSAGSIRIHRSAGLG